MEIKAEAIREKFRLACMPFFMQQNYLAADSTALTAVLIDVIKICTNKFFYAHGSCPYMCRAYEYSINCS